MILPPYEVAAIVRSTGLEPLGRPVRQGQAYAVRAIDDAGEEVRVIVDARLGRITKLVPLMDPPRARRSAAAAATAEDGLDRVAARPAGHRRGGAARPSQRHQNQRYDGYGH